MSEKIRLKNGQEFEIIPMGIELRGNQRIFKFKSTLTYAEVLGLLSNEDNVSSISYVLADGTIDKTYLDCVVLKGLGFNPGYQVDENTTADVYTAEISVDAVERALKNIQKTLTELKENSEVSNATVDYILCEAIPTLVG